MAYPSGAEIRALLPSSDPPVDEADCDTFVAEWISLVEEAAGNPVDDLGVPVSVESARTRRIVRRGAWVDAMEQMMAVSGYMGDPEAIATARTRVEDDLKAFDADYTTETEAASVRLSSLPWTRKLPVSAEIGPWWLY